MAQRVLVFGKHGQLAQGLARNLQPSQFEVLCLGRAEIDLSQPNSIQDAIDAFRPNWVINASAYTAVDLAESDQEQAFLLNRDYVHNIAVVCQRAHIPLIHFSTDYVFDGSKTTSYVETDQTHPMGIYGLSKLAGEQAILGLELQAYIMRTSWVCSPYGKNFVKTMLNLAEQKDTISVVNDQFGAPTFVDDLTTACHAIMEQNKPAGLYHFSCAGETSWFGFAQEIMQTLENHGRKFCSVEPIPSANYPTPAKRPANSRLDCTKFEKTFQFERRTWQTALADCLKQLKI